MKQEFTNEEKDNLLLMHKFTKIVGYAMDCGAPDADNVIISLEEIRNCVGNAVTVPVVQAIIRVMYPQE